MSTAPLEPSASAGWIEMLERIEATLEQMLSQTVEPGQEPYTAPPATPEDRLSEAWLVENQGRLQASLDRAEQAAAAIDALLQGEAERVTGCLDGLKKIQDRVAGCAPPTV